MFKESAGYLEKLSNTSVHWVCNSPDGYKETGWRL